MLARTSAGFSTTSKPATMACPELGLINVDKILIAVVLPAPLWPSKAQIDPVGTLKLTPCSAGTCPLNVFARLCSSITGCLWWKVDRQSRWIPTVSRHGGHGGLAGPDCLQPFVQPGELILSVVVSAGRASDLAASGDGDGSSWHQH